MLRDVAVGFDQLSEVDVVAEHILDGRTVRTESIGRKLEPTQRGEPQFQRELGRGFRRALVNVPSQNEFGFPFDGNETPRIALFIAVSHFFFRALLAPDESQISSA